MRAETTSNHYRAADLESGWEAAILARALELAAEAAQSAVQAEDAWRATSGYASDLGDWAEVAASAARALGLQPSLRPEPPPVGPRDRPALVRAGPGRWLVVVGRRGRRLRVVQLDPRGETKMSVTPERLAEAANGQPWLHLQPLLALDPIGQARRPRLAERPWLRLRAFLGLERRELWVVVVYAIVIGALTLATPIAVQALVNTVAFGSVLQPLVVLTLLLFGGLAFSGILTVLEAYVVEVLQRRVFVRVADDFGRRLPTITADALDRRHGPELVNRFFDVLTVQKSLAVLLLDGLAIVLQTVIGMVLLGFYHPLLLAFDAVLIVLLVVVLALGRGAVETGLGESSAKYRTVAWLEDISRAPHLFRGAAAQRHAALRAEHLCRDYLSARRSHFRVLLRQIVGGVGLQIITIVALLGVGGWLVIDRQLTLGQLVAAELIIAAMSSGFVKLGKNLEKAYDLNVGVLKLASVVDLPTERRGGEPLPAGGPAAVALRSANLERGGRALLSDVDLEIAPGQRVWIRGDAGSGKSTLLELLAGQRSLAGGCIQIGGLDLRRADLASVRDRVALVRGVEFVDGSIIDNLRLGLGRVDEPSVRQLMRMVALEQAIDRLPEGLSTRMLPGGAPLSDTQARRLALVRALAGRPRVLILDRALDGLGLPAADKEALLDLVLGPEATWTAIVVTDDPEVADRCDRTMQLDDHTLKVVQ